MDPNPNDSTVALSDNTAVTGTDFAMTASQLLSLAKNDDLLKLVKNIYLNYDTTSGILYNLRPDYKWRGDYTAISNTYQVPINYTYISYQFQMDTNSTEVTIDKICGTGGQDKVIVELFPSGDVPTNGGPIPLYSPITPISNNFPMTKTLRSDGFWDASPESGGSGSDFFATDAYGGLSYSLGSANLTGAIPEGLWTWKIGGALKGKYDVAVASPVTATNKIKGFVPVIKLNVDNNKIITSIDVKWYTLNDAGTDYVEFTDINVLKYLIGSGVDVYIDNTTDNVRTYDQLRLNVGTQTQVTPNYTWYYGNNGPPAQQAQGVGIFYSSGGVGHFFEWFPTPP